MTGVRTTSNGWVSTFPLSQIPGQVNTRSKTVSSELMIGLHPFSPEPFSSRRDELCKERRAVSAG